MMRNVNGYAVTEAGGKLSPYQYELNELGQEEVDIKVHYCCLLYTSPSPRD